MEAPEKIYIHVKNDKVTNTWNSTWVGVHDLEYIRKDAFIEKACLWLSNVSIEDMTYKYNDFDTSKGWYKLIENFKNYMKGK